LINVADTEVEMLLVKLTFLELNNIKEIMEEHNKAPEKRHAQRILANEMTSLIHG
jgi:tyrosyl-tRNA synthetase